MDNIILHEKQKDTFLIDNLLNGIGTNIMSMVDLLNVMCVALEEDRENEFLAIDESYELAIIAKQMGDNFYELMDLCAKLKSRNEYIITTNQGEEI